MLKGQVSYVSSRGYFFVETADSEGFVTKYFGLAKNIIRNRQWLEVNAECEFEISSETPKGECRVAERINFTKPALNSDGLRGLTNVLGGAK